jgi:RNA polymerase-binding transcription factor DksA
VKDNTVVLSIIEKLEKEQAQITQELLDLREALKAEVDADLGEGDPQLVEQERIIARIQERERQLKTLERTLEQARQGRYGICEHCHKPIDPARLEALPDTTLCIECKKISERRHQHHIPLN